MSPNFETEANNEPLLNKGEEEADEIGIVVVDEVIWICNKQRSISFLRKRRRIRYNNIFKEVKENR